MKVLIADDDPLYRNLLQRQVKQWGYEPQCVADGVPAWKLLCEDESPARLVILDWQMQAMDGIELCGKIKGDADRPFTFVFLLTSRKRKEDMLLGLESGADDFLSKPVDPVLLRSRLKVAQRIVKAVPEGDRRKPSIPNYGLGESLGKGAFATVWKAKSSKTGRIVALKVLPANLCSEKVSRRFAREIRLLSELDHPNVAKIYDSQIGDELAYYAMDLFTQGTLDEFVRKRSLGGIEIIKMFCSVLCGLEHLHSNGIIHRDMKPSNIMIDDNDQPRIVDFGLGKSMFNAVKVDPEITLDQAVMGTPLFMSPEQARGDRKAVDQRTDIYAAAVILYVLLLKRHPKNVDSADHEDLEELLSSLYLSEVVEPRKINPRFNQRLQRIRMKGLAKDPSQRYQSARDFTADIRGWMADRKRVPASR